MNSPDVLRPFPDNIGRFRPKQMPSSDVLRLSSDELLAAVFRGTLVLLAGVSGPQRSDNGSFVLLSRRLWTVAERHGTFILSFGAYRPHRSDNGSFVLSAGVSGPHRSGHGALVLFGCRLKTRSELLYSGQMKRLLSFNGICFRRPQNYYKKIYCFF